MAQVDRVAVRVDDLDAAVADFADVFGMEFEVTDVEALGLRVAICDQGIELVEVRGDAPKLVETYGGGMLAGVSVNVPDLELVRRRLLERGVEFINEVEANDLKEIYCDKGTFHGLPLIVAEYEGGFLEALHGPGDMPEDYAPKVTWYKPEFAPEGHVE